MRQQRRKRRRFIGELFGKDRVLRPQRSLRLIDEALSRDLSWEPTSAITQWEYGNLSGELVEISDADAAQLIERFREKWSAQQN